MNITLPPVPHIAAQAFGERFYTIREIAKAWHLSEDAVRRLFKNEPGVLVFGTATKGSKRRYTTMRIPESVLQRVYRQYAIYYNVTTK